MSEGRRIRVGCRGTELCRAQTSKVLDRLSAAHPDVEYEIVEVPGNGEDHPILEALGAGMIDLQVRGARETPVELPDDVEIAACTERVDPFDVLIAKEGMLLEDLPEGAVLGVESARVAVQIGTFREDLEIRRLDGSVENLLPRLNHGELAGFIVAAEDVDALGWQDTVSEMFTNDILLPAAGQGSYALLTRKSDEASARIATAVDHELTRQIVRAERAFLRELEIKLTDPVAVHGSFDQDTLVLEALLGDEVSGAILRDDLDGEPSEEDDLGVRLAKLFLADGARDYLASYR